MEQLRKAVKMITINELLNNEPVQGWETKEFTYKDHIFEIRNYRHEQIIVRDYTNAGKRGKMVNALSFCFRNIDSYQEIMEYRDFEEFYKLLTKEVNIDDYSICSDSEKISVYLREEQATRFLAKNLSVYKPLKEVPKKWTIPHAIRALINHQFEWLHCDGVYTDDYAYDNAVNFREGEIKDAVNFAKKIIESPSGWWCNDCDKNGVVSICCHSFDCNSFKFKLA